MPRGSVEVFSHFGAHDGKGPSKPMPIRLLQSRKQPGHINILMNPKLDDSWIDIVEAYDVNAKDLLEALCRVGVLKSYRLARKPKKHKLTLFGNTILSEGKPISVQELSATVKGLQKKTAEVYTFR